MGTWNSYIEACPLKQRNYYHVLGCSLRDAHFMCE